MCEFSAYFAFDKATDGRTDIKHEMWKTLCSVSLLKSKCFPHFVFYICLSLCRRQRMPKIHTLCCLVHIKKRSFLTSCVFWAVWRWEFSTVDFMFQTMSHSEGESPSLHRVSDPSGLSRDQVSPRSKDTQAYKVTVWVLPPFSLYSPSLFLSGLPFPSWQGHICSNQHPHCCLAFFCCCCFSVPQLKTLRVIRYVHPHPYMYEYWYTA